MLRATGPKKQLRDDDEKCEARQRHYNDGAHSYFAPTPELIEHHTAKRKQATVAGAAMAAQLIGLRVKLQV